MLRDFVDKPGLHEERRPLDSALPDGADLALDVVALVRRRKIGRHKMAPTISPNKSWEGIIAGVVTVLIFFGRGRSSSRRYWAATIRWFSWGVASHRPHRLRPRSAGRPFESPMKEGLRDQRHGRHYTGPRRVMDRFDSTLFAAPAVFYLVYFVISRRCHDSRTTAAATGASR